MPHTSTRLALSTCLSVLIGAVACSDPIAPAAVEAPLPVAVVASPAPPAPTTTVLETTTTVVGSAPPEAAPAPVPSPAPSPAPPTPAPAAEKDGVEWAGLRSFPYGTESDCAAEVVDDNKQVWLIDRGEEKCGWKADVVDVGERCGGGSTGPLKLTDDITVTVLERGAAVDKGDEDVSHTYRPASLVVKHGAVTKTRNVRIHSFCRR